MTPMSVHVVGLGRAGGAIAARLREAGVLVERDAADLVVIAVPDAAIAATARSLPVGPWIAHISGATPLAALAPHDRRFGVHPLQTLVRSRGPEQLDGAWAAVTAESEPARTRARWLAGTLGLQPFDLDEASRALYHAGAVLASNHLVTLQRAAARVFERAGAPPAALVPLMRRVIDNDFELTGPIARGDRATVDAHLAALRAALPDLETLYATLSEATVP